MRGQGPTAKQVMQLFHVTRRKLGLDGRASPQRLDCHRVPPLTPSVAFGFQPRLERLVYASQRLEKVYPRITVSGPRLSLLLLVLLHLATPLRLSAAL